MNKKTIWCGLLMAVATLGASAQSGTNSPYSQYGFGVMSDAATGFNRGMNGLGVALRQGNQVNPMNPASYSAVDSITFIFDAGMSGQITNFSENGTKKNAKNADFEYAVASFRAFRHLGVGFGVLPFSNVGYSYSSQGSLNDGQSVNYVNTYSGSGGVHQAFVGLGWEPLRNLSVGANFSYLWGDLTRTVDNNYANGSGTTISTINRLTKYYKADIHNYKLDLGLQYALPVGKQDRLTVGATFSPKHNLNANPKCTVVSTNSETGVSNTTSYSVSDGLELPNMIAGGVAWKHGQSLLLGVDYSLQQWSGVSFPVYTVVGDEPQYRLNSQYFTDRHRLTVGGEYCQNPLSRRFMGRIRYRLGATYGTPYYKINGKDGPKEVSVSGGFGIPIMNAYNNRSVLNISGQWVRQSGAGMITENTFRINIGITFNERWFMKWKVE